MHGGIWTLCIDLPMQELQELRRHPKFPRGAPPCVNYLAGSMENARGEEQRNDWQHSESQTSLQPHLTLPKSNFTELVPYIFRSSSQSIKIHDAIANLCIFLCTVIVSISCNKNHVEIEELNNFSKSSEDELLNRQANNNDEIAFNKSEIHNLNHNNKLLDSVVIINNSSDFESLFATSESNNIKSSDPKELAPASSYRKLPRHQRAIAAVAEKKGLLKNGGGERILRRGKRYLQFAKGSRVSWRTAGKNNILNINTLWAYGYGFRVNFPFPGPDESRRPFFKRDVLHSLEDVLNGHGLDGRACVLKSYCTAALDVDSSISGGMLFKMLKLIFTLHEHDKRHFSYLRLENCKQILHSHCPLSFDSISPYTDDV